MDWEPNVDGVEYFCSEVWPAIKAEVPDARFRIVGRNPDRRVQKWASDSIEVTGRVPSVIEHLQQSAAVIVPSADRRRNAPEDLRSDGNRRRRWFRRPIGAEGLDVHHGRDIILADDAKSFAQAVIMLLRDRELRRRYEKAAAATAGQYDWPAIGERFGEILQSVVREESQLRQARSLRARHEETRSLWPSAIAERQQRGMSWEGDLLSRSRIPPRARSSGCSAFLRGVLRPAGGLGSRSQDSFPWPKSPPFLAIWGLLNSLGRTKRTFKDVPREGKLLLLIIGLLYS